MTFFLPVVTRPIAQLYAVYFAEQQQENRVCLTVATPYDVVVCMVLVVTKQLRNSSFGCCDKVPGQQLLDAVNGVVGNALQDLAQIRFRIQAVQFGGADQAVDGGSPLAPRI
jgi:hypothetical protein